MVGHKFSLLINCQPEQNDLFGSPVLVLFIRQAFSLFNFIPCNANWNFPEFTLNEFNLKHSRILEKLCLRGLKIIFRFIITPVNVVIVYKDFHF